MMDTPDRILRLKTVLQLTGSSRSTMYRKIHNGTSPTNIRISTRCTGWRETAINDWLRNPMFYNAAEKESRLADSIAATQIARDSCRRMAWGSWVSFDHRERVRVVMTGNQLLLTVVILTVEVPDAQASVDQRRRQTISCVNHWLDLGYGNSQPLQYFSALLSR